MKRRLVRLSLCAPVFMAIVLATVAPVAMARTSAAPAAYTSEFTVNEALPMICPQPDDPKSVQIMIDIDSAYAHQMPSWFAPVVGRVFKWQCFDAIGRNKQGDWTLVNYGSSVAWLNGSMFRARGSVTSLPLSDQVVARSELTPGLLPKGLPTITYRMRALYQQSARYGNDLSMFTVMGDCNSESGVYLGRFAAGGFDISGFPTLKSTALWFTQAFTRTSLATHGSFNAAMAFDPMWADPNQCQSNEGPLACELRVSNASILIIAVGTGDQYNWSTFGANYRRIIDYTLQQGVLPVLMTKADALESQDGGAPVDFINNTVRSLGKEYGVPVIDFWLATRSLPNMGLVDEHNTQGQAIHPFHLNEQGMDMRILMTLQTLKAITGR